MPTISVILPIYNAEPFLEECLTSIKNQTFTDLEILCVNDGSTDSSVETIQKFCNLDDRFVLLSKPNGGYGHSLNYGLKHAQGKYISIIEPDDFINPRMYEDLLLFAKANNNADVIKGSYWEYFDTRDDFGEVLRKPNLIREMKQTPFSFNLKDDAEVFTHHPSIWSALYKKDFLDFNEIRFVEPKGAGWADNPFFAETLIKAREIIWVPNGYYYYRQTNPSASSFLKDYRIPFDRLREMRAILQKAQANDEIWGAFYRREFDYIHSIINEFGFQEKNPEIYSLIHEVLSSLDEKILLSSKFIKPKDIEYYKKFLKEYRPAFWEKNVSEPFECIEEDFTAADISFILPFENHATWLSNCIESIQKCDIKNKEIICIDCGSSDRSFATCSHLANKYSNLILVKSVFGSFAEGINSVIPLLKSKYFYIFNPAYSIEGGNLTQVITHLLNSGTDVATLDSEKRFLAEIMCRSKKAQITNKDDTVVYDVDAKDISPFLLNIFRINEPSVVYRTKFIQELNLDVEIADCGNAISLVCKALIEAQAISYFAGTCYKALNLEPKLVPFLPDIHDELVKEELPVLPAIFNTLNCVTYTNKNLTQSTGNLLVSAFMYDISTRCFPETLYTYVDTYLENVVQFCTRIEGRDFFDVEQYYDFQMIERKGLVTYLAAQFLYKTNDIKSLKQDLESVFSSTRFTVGSRIAELYQKTSVGPLRYIINKRMQ